jgi:glycosyltransferase involved in cell wall biosynthesis
VEHSDANLFSEEFRALIAQIPDSNGSGYYGRSTLKVGIITDNFEYETLACALDLTYLSPATYAAQIADGGFDLVMYVSCWFGLKDNEYSGREGIDAAIEILNYAKDQQIPTVFYTIEDTSNYGVFIDVAKTANYIFTTAREKLPDYRRDTGNRHVHVLEFGVNPLVHNPVGMMRRGWLAQGRLRKNVLFAGSWMQKYPKRQESICMLFDGVLASTMHALLVLDRNSGRASANYHYPSKYEPYIAPAIDYLELQKASKLFDYSLNLNSIIDSATMCSMRTYEMQALGVLLVSNYALALSRSFPGIFTPLFAEEVGRILDGYTPDEVLSMQLEGIRAVFTGRTVFDRLNTVFTAVGLGERFVEKGVLVLCDEATAEVRADFEAQTYTARRLVDLSAPGPDALAALPSEGYCVYLGPGRHSRHFLEDLVNAHKFTDVGYASFASWEEKEGAYEYAEGPAPARDALFDLRRASVSEIASDRPLAGLMGFKVLAPRYGRDTSATEKRLALIIPVYNNGAYLKGRSFRSLLRSSVFDQMRVYLIDDGSTDGVTPQVVAEIAKAHDNVEAVYFVDGGSGSASRPRNKGLELAQEPLVTFLDPDDEAIGDGYARLLATFDAEPGLAFVTGGTHKLYADASHAPGLSPADGPILDSRAFLRDRKFMPLNCQTMIVRRDYLAEHDIRFVEGGLGEDTLFFQELCGASSVKAHGIDVPFQVYFADRDDSAASSISVSFFEKHLATEKAAALFFHRHELLNDYVNLRFEYYFKRWYLTKLSLLPIGEMHGGLAILNEILELFSCTAEHHV